MQIVDTEAGVWCSRLTDNFCWSLIQESSTAALIGAASDFSVRQLESVISELQLYYVPLYDIIPNMKMDLNSPVASQQPSAILVVETTSDALNISIS